LCEIGREPLQDLGGRRDRITEVKARRRVRD
jgi:hypothetical protein